MPSVPMTEDTRKAFAREFLYLSQCYLNEAKALRKRRIELAQKYGLTNSEIGEELGMTEAAVRMIIKRGDA